MWPQGMGQSFLDGDSPQHSRRERQHSVAGAPGPQEQQVSADEAHWDPKRQQATRQASLGPAANCRVCSGLDSPTGACLSRNLTYCKV